MNETRIIISARLKLEDRRGLTLAMDHFKWLGSVLSGGVRLTDAKPKLEDGRETLSETLQEALGNTLTRALEREGADGDAVRKAFNECHLFSHASLFRLVGPGAHDNNVAAFLSRASQVELQYGRMLWDRDLVQQDIAAEKKGRTLPEPAAHRGYSSPTDGPSTPRTTKI